MNTLNRYILIGFLIILLFLVRAMAQEYFYDPLILFFEHDYLNNPLPDIDGSRFSMFMSLRYWINSFISIGIIYLLFPSKNNLIFTLKIYVIAYFALGLGFLILFNVSSAGNFRALFYTRRFIIHPLLLLLLIPAFYRKNLIASNSSTNNS